MFNLYLSFFQIDTFQLLYLSKFLNRMNLNPKSDPLGQAIYNYLFKSDNTPVLVSSNVVEDEELPPEYFFREYNDMPMLEKVALKKCKGNILDVGAGAGCHSLYLQNAGFNVTSLEISELCCEVLKKRGLKNVINSDIYSFSDQKYDTILLLMNGIGISGNIQGMTTLLSHLKSLLSENGSIILDSSDLIYLYKDEDESIYIDINAANYYGEIDYQIKYKDISGDSFSWLFADSVLLDETAAEIGLKSEILEYGPHYDYLAKLFIK